MHGAWSGIFGYYVGLAALRPQSARELLIRGYLTAVAAHTLWNSLQTLEGLLMVPIGMLVYAALVACILQARKISPTRAENFATTLGQKA